MPLQFLTCFPREIRDQIYTYVLASPSGVVTLSPWTVEVANSLWLMRTCHQIHRECKDIIWRDNGLGLRESTQLCEKMRSLVRHRSVFERVRQLRVSLEMMDRDELEWFSKATSALREWCQKGRLSSITLVASWEKPSGIDEFREILNLRKHGESLDGRLFLESTTWTRTEITTGWPRFSHWGKQRWLKEMLLDSSGISELLGEINKVFGGKLYVDGQLCFKDGVQLQACNLNPRNGEVKIVPWVHSARQERRR